MTDFKGFKGITNERARELLQQELASTERRRALMKEVIGYTSGHNRTPIKEHEAADIWALAVQAHNGATQLKRADALHQLRAILAEHCKTWSKK